MKNCLCYILINISSKFILSHELYTLSCECFIFNCLVEKKKKELCINISCHCILSSCVIVAFWRFSIMYFIFLTGFLPFYTFPVFVCRTSFSLLTSLVSLVSPFYIIFFYFPLLLLTLYLIHNLLSHLIRFSFIYLS